MRERGLQLGRKMPLAAVVAVVIGILSVGTLASPRAAADTPGQPSSCPTPNPPNELILGGGTPQTAQLNTAFEIPLQVALANSNGCPVTTSVVGTPVTFTAPSSGASGSFATSGTNTVTVGADVSGNASAPTFTANDTAGSYTVTATSADGSVSFSMTNSAPGKPATITVGVAASEATKTGTRFAIRLAVTVTDALGNDVPGVFVTFTAPAKGASGRFATRAHARTVSVQTDGRGIAVAPPFIANAKPGGYIVIASIPHGPRTAFALVNDAP
jgi:hypothetical protein